ncbi:MAG: transposase [Planctomycetes bacterium]|nr:transposase [Planctomycetota bacterium]
MGKSKPERGLFGQPVKERSDPEIVRIVKLAVRLARRHLSDYAHEKSPRKFTQPQLFACLILKAHLGCTYRKVEELLILMPAVREAIGLQSVPRFTTLQTFAGQPRIMELIDGVLASIGRAISKRQPQDAAADGTGMQTTSASAYFVSRAGRKHTRFVKLMIGVLCAAVIPCGLVVDWGPSHDMRQAWTLRQKLKAATKPTWLWGDGAYDSEEWHRANWEEWGVKSYAPTTVRRADGKVNGFYRNAFTTPVKEYGRRWMVESVNSGIKRTTGSTLRSRKQNTLFAEAALKVAAYAIKV